jgi:hypothetical protein
MMKSTARILLPCCVALTACGGDGGAKTPAPAADAGSSARGHEDGGARSARDAATAEADAALPEEDAAAGADAAAGTDASSSSDAGERRDGGGDVVDAGRGTGARAPTNTAAPPASPAATTFGQVYAVLTSQCGTCHTQLDDGDLDFSSRATAYSQLVGHAAAGPDCAGSGEVRVIAGEPDQSLLIQKLEGTSDCGARMPEGRPPLPQSTIDEIRAWIAAGARNN